MPGFHGSLHGNSGIRTVQQNNVYTRIHVVINDTAVCIGGGGYVSSDVTMTGRESVRVMDLRLIIRAQNRSSVTKDLDQSSATQRVRHCVWFSENNDRKIP